MYWFEIITITLLVLILFLFNKYTQIIIRDLRTYKVQVIRAVKSYEQYDYDENVIFSKEILRDYGPMKSLTYSFELDMVAPPILGAYVGNIREPIEFIEIVSKEDQEDYDYICHLKPKIIRYAAFDKFIEKNFDKNDKFRIDDIVGHEESMELIRKARKLIS